ncbi:UNVERIFIED_ORG: hypothetical protein BDK47_14916 [Anoxybacillus amylolyticus]
MTTATRPSVGLTQLIDFTIKSSSAKINMVRKIKYQDAYHPSFLSAADFSVASFSYHSPLFHAVSFFNSNRNVSRPFGVMSVCTSALPFRSHSFSSNSSGTYAAYGLSFPF